ncbi:MAG: DUF4278 domain-containing protein [Cyanothece sp. SIO1E1]|nr:DUF4278 domain-containing protein [Cyanothece sp. SIO1E1]
MKLTYRGISYQTAASTLATNDTDLTAKYRGQAYRVRGTNVSQPHSMSGMRYRGVVH